MGHNNLTPERDWRALAIYQVMVGSFVHSDKGAEGTTTCGVPRANARTEICAA